MQPPNHKKIQARLNLSKIQRRIQVVPPVVVVTPPNNITKPILTERQKKRIELIKTRKITGVITTQKIQKPFRPTAPAPTKQIVGKAIKTNADLLGQTLEIAPFPISNNIGIGILSYNRAASLRRLLNSIMMNTDLRRTTVFVSDDASTDQDTVNCLNELSNNKSIVLIRNDKQIGVAGNSNRLLRCLSRFRFGILMNDDVEVLQPNWEYFYQLAMVRTGFHHFIYRQPGIYAAEAGAARPNNGLTLRVVQERPHGAVLAFTNDMLRKVGYFDEAYGLYGMEHVDWSQKAWEFGLQAKGFYDVEGSGAYFKLHNDESAVNDRNSLLIEARKTFERRLIQRFDPSPESKVPAVTYIVPFRNMNRDDSISTVINNIRAQHFPEIEIIMVEQDASTKIDVSKHLPVNYLLAQETTKLLFNKSKAFNYAAARASHPCLILQDADMLSQWYYTSLIMNILESADACHVGRRVLYADKESTDKINSSKTANLDVVCERIVGYFEGGSTACRADAYWKVGGHNENFVGYGCEDCEFYARLTNRCGKWFGERTVDFLHLWHDRADGWDKYHQANKQLEANLSKKPMSERIETQRQQLRKLGYEKFLK